MSEQLYQDTISPEDLIDDDPRIDVSRLEKGDRVPVHEIETTYNVSRDTDAYRLVALQLRTEIEREFSRRDPSIRVTTRVLKDLGVVVLTDEEAVEQNIRATAQSIRRVRRSHRRQLGVDRSKVSPKTLPVLDRALEVGGRIVAAISREIRRPVPVVAATRSTPVIKKD